LVFLAPDDQRMIELADATRDYLAWNNIAGRTRELNLNAQQASQATTRRQQADDTVTLRIAGAYIWAPSCSSRHTGLPSCH
jgi:hypothetical protein